MVGCGDVRVILKTVLIGCEDDLEVNAIVFEPPRPGWEIKVGLMNRSWIQGLYS